MLLRCSGTSVTFFRRSISIKEKLKDYKFPEIHRQDCEQASYLSSLCDVKQKLFQNHIRGWGPGGQNVNKAQNAVQLKHIPTGVTVKVHESRLLNKNIDIAFERLKLAVDRHVNGDSCYEAQYAKLLREKEAKAKEHRRKHREEKMKLKNQEDKENDD